jgi:hypothetical protein
MKIRGFDPNAKAQKIDTLRCVCASLWPWLLTPNDALHIHRVESDFERRRRLGLTGYAIGGGVASRGTRERRGVMDWVATMMSQFSDTGANAFLADARPPSPEAPSLSEKQEQEHHRIPKKQKQLPSDEPDADGPDYWGVGSPGSDSEPPNYWGSDTTNSQQSEERSGPLPPTTTTRLLSLEDLPSEQEEEDEPLDEEAPPLPPREASLPRLRSLDDMDSEEEEEDEPLDEEAPLLPLEASDDVVDDDEEEEEKDEPLE